MNLKCRVFERCSRVGRAMTTLDGDGRTVPWVYVPGSGLSGFRLYNSPDGTVKRLASHTHKQRRSCVRVPSTLTDAGSPGSADGNVKRARDGTDRPQSAESDPNHDQRNEVPGRGRATGDGAAGGGSTLGDLFSPDSFLADPQGVSDGTGGRLTAEELSIPQSSTLENDDGSDPEVIVAM